jgi:hypothetical protein
MVGQYLRVFGCDEDDVLSEDRTDLGDEGQHHAGLEAEIRGGLRELRGDDRDVEAEPEAIRNREGGRFVVGGK